MYLVLVTALIAVCGADKLDRTYLPPASAATAGGNPGSLQTPYKTFNQGLGGLPKGSYSNDFEGVVVDAAAPGTRASGADETGLGGPRITYGSTDSKVGEAAFTADTAFPRVGVNSGFAQGAPSPASNFAENLASRPERIQAPRDRVSNTVKYENEVSPDRFNYAFETDNGIVAEENGIEVNGVKAQGGYSYTGDDGQVYSVTYTADEDGYRPKGDHLPTPPPIPVEILESLEKNAQDEAAGIVDDGSYDAKKYNTGEDYTKSDNEQYNSGQPTQFGNKPQSDAVASSSFISQNNQGFVRPNSQQFGSSSTFDSSKNKPVIGNTFGVTSDPINSAQNTQSFGFGVASKNEYLPPKTIYNQNQRPSASGLQGVHNDTPISASSISNIGSSFNKNQNTEVPVFIPLSQQKLQDDRPKRPQSNSPVFGKPTVIDSTLAIKDPFAKRPSTNRFTQNSQPNQKPQSFGGSFEVVSGNVYSSKNEYLPPRRPNNNSNQYNGNQYFQSTNSGTQPNQQTTSSQTFNPNTPSASAFASVSRPSGLQATQQYNNQPNPQYAGNNLFNQNPINRPFNQRQPIPNLPNVPGFNRPPGSQFQYKPPTFASQPPTLKPQSELTTPLESVPDQNKDSAPTPVVDGPDSPSPTSPSALLSFGSQPPNSFLGQHSFNSNKIQQAQPTHASPSVVSTYSDQSITPNAQNSNELGRPSSTGNFGSQSQFNKTPVNGQYSISTQKPIFNQYNQQQGSDDSYYYNTPSKPFNTPTPRPQASIFPSSSFNQPSKVTQAPFGGRPQSSNSASFPSPQTNTPTDASRYPKPSTIGPVSPTLPTQQDEQTGSNFQTQFNKVTQASSSSFPSPTFATSADFQGNQFGPFDTKPLQPVDRLNQAGQSFNKQDSSTQPQQQNGGDIYEYKKPPQTLPTPQNGASSSPGQYGQTSQFSSAPSSFNTAQPTSGAYKPSSPFGSAFTQQPFGQRPSSVVPQDNQGLNANKPVQNQQKPGQFLSQPSNPGLNGPVQGAAKFPPTYSNQSPPCCKKFPSPSQINEAKEQNGSPQFTSQFRPNQGFSQQGSEQGVKPAQSVSTFAGVGENFGGPRKPPSFDETGYHY